MVAGCRSSGELTESSGTSGSVLISTGPTKLNSIHGFCETAGDALCVVYDNVAASGKVVARMFIDSQDPGGVPQPSKSMEYDMHGVLCQIGIFVVISTPTGGVTHGFTIEYS